MNKQYFSVPVKYNNLEQLQIDDLKIPVEILVMHDQINLNQSNFDFEVIDNEITKESIKNIPILGYIKKIDGSDEQDFAGHEMEVSFTTDGIKITYLERPIGVIPETNSYEYVEKDGKKYVKVVGYLWKDYLNDGYEILQENPNKSVSMEIVVDSYEVKKDGIVDIKAYRYTGITVLGDDVLPGMSGANMQVIGQFSENQKFSTEFYERVEKLNSELKNYASFKISSYFIDQEKAEQLVQKANTIFTQLGFECSEYIVDGKEYQITGIINKTLNEEAIKVWGFDIYDKDTITINSLDFKTIDTSSVSISSVELLLNKNIYTSQQHFTLKINNFTKGGETEEMKKEGGTKILDAKFELIKKYENLTDEDVADLKINHEQYSLEDFDTKLKELSDAKNTQPVTDFTLTSEQLNEEVRKVLRTRKVISKDWWGDEYSENEFYYRDIKDNLVIVIDNAWENYYGIPYVVNGDAITIDFENKIPYMYDWRPRIDGEVVNSFAKQEFEEKLKVFTDKAVKKAKTEVATEYESKISDFNSKIEELTNNNSQQNISLEEFEAFKSKVAEYETSISTLTEQFNSLKTENETLTQSNQSLQEFKSNTELAQQEAFEQQQLQLKSELVENFSKVLTPEEIKSVQDKDISVEEMEKEFKLLYADKDLQVKFNKKQKKAETEIPLNTFTYKKKDDWTSCIKK